MQVVIGQWAAIDLEATGRWLEAMPAGKSRDETVGNFALQLSGQNPVTAVKWAESIADPAAQLRRLETIGQNWLQSDEDAARLWIQNSTLSPEIKIRLLGK